MKSIPIDLDSTQLTSHFVNAIYRLARVRPDVVIHEDGLVEVLDSLELNHVHFFEMQDGIRSVTRDEVMRLIEVHNVHMTFLLQGEEGKLLLKEAAE